MRKMIAFLLASAMSMGLAACGTGNSAGNPDTDTSGSRTEAPAIEDGRISGTDSAPAHNDEQTAVEDYPLDHDLLVDQAADEQDANARPELATRVENFEQYEYVFLGYPNWWGDMPMAVYSFLEEYDFGAKTIIPFITHGGSRASNTVNTISELQPGALMMGNELVLSRNDVADSEETIVEWAQGLGINAVAKLPEAGDGSTVSTAAADAHNSRLFTYGKKEMFLQSPNTRRIMEIIRMTRISVLIW